MSRMINRVYGYDAFEVFETKEDAVQSSWEWSQR
jgi:hypothetical protein